MIISRSQSVASSRSCSLSLLPSPINTSTLQIVGAILPCGLSEAIEASFLKRMSSASLISSKFEGHKAPVLSLDYSSSAGNDNSSHLLLSGSEDRTARLWDVRDSKRRACLCIPVQGEVLSVKFAPRLLPQHQQLHQQHPTTTTTTTKQDDDDNSLENMEVDSPSTTITNSPFAKDHTIFLSMEHVVLEYDLRMASGPIVSAPTRDLSQTLQNQDEINQLSAIYFSKPTNTSSNNGRPSQKSKRGKGKGGSNNKNSSGGGGISSSSSSPPELFLAAADDAGTIRFMEYQSSQSQILHHDPNGVAVVPTCTFRPNGTMGTSHKSLELASGGTDCKIHLWDLQKPKRPISSYTIQQPESGDTSSKPQVCNPPMVYSLAWSPSGRLLAAGLGDGNIPIFSVENRNLVQTGYLPDGHDSSVASVLFPEFGKTNERLVVSGGSDGSILCWDIGPTVIAQSTTTSSNEDPKGLFAETFLGGSPNNNGDDDTISVDDLSRQTEELSLFGKPKVVFGIPHRKKINWMTTSDDSIFVADTSHDITAYKLPLR